MNLQDNEEHAILLASKIRDYLKRNQLNAELPAITYEVLALQIINSVEHERSTRSILGSKISTECSNPDSVNFDPIKAIITLKNANYDEACWVSFLLTYTDDGAESGWSFMRQLYAGKGLHLKTPLTWEEVNSNRSDLNEKLETLAMSLAMSEPKPKFGHHRAYESLNHLPIVFSSYIDFINENGGHQSLFQPQNKKMSKSDYFKALYPIIRQNIYRFGRLSTFEYLCLLGKMGLANIEPDSCYIAEASGPKRGARLLFGMLDNSSLDNHSIGLADYLDVGYQEMEAALCHWQKSPNRYIQYD